ncbi:4Fe-4S binding protein [Agromyces sp. MMS24-JH15]|uniref:4Fe-4S binding protein n=1 Tax=Agromyces sp. MMS24-JH15 TaxID=3243765 RepID=UPI00374828B0
MLFHWVPLIAPSVREVPPLRLSNRTAIVSLAARRPRWFCSWSCPVGPIVTVCCQLQHELPLIVAYTR